jgi:hypothetical protein
VPLHTLRADIEYGFAEAAPPTVSSASSAGSSRARCCRPRVSLSRPGPPAPPARGGPEDTSRHAVSPSAPSSASQHEGPHARQGQGRLPTSPSATSGCRPLECGLHHRPPDRGRPYRHDPHVKREAARSGSASSPTSPFTKKPAETRMGKGKGAVEGWVAVVKPGRVLYEIEGVRSATRSTTSSSRSARATTRTMSATRSAPATPSSSSSRVRSAASSAGACSPSPRRRRSEERLAAAGPAPAASCFGDPGPPPAFAKAGLASEASAVRLTATIRVPPNTPFQTSAPPGMRGRRCLIRGRPAQEG